MRSVFDFRNNAKTITSLSILDVVSSRITGPNI